MEFDASKLIDKDNHPITFVLLFFFCLLQPVSSSKDKPSKIHRRKHQIGSLLHDAKAREMELMERRARGSLTKAETQAKYGW